MHKFLDSVKPLKVHQEEVHDLSRPIADENTERIAKSLPKENLQAPMDSQMNSIRF